MSQDQPLIALDELIRWDGYAQLSLRVPAEHDLRAALAALTAAEEGARRGAARSVIELVQIALGDVLHAALLLHVAAAELGSALDDDRDTLTDEQAQHVRVVRAGDEPRVARILNLLRDVLRDGVGRAGDGVLAAVVDDGGHGSPSVGRPGVVPVASAGSSADVPATDAPTVGAPTDTPAVAPPAGVSVDRARCFRCGAPAVYAVGIRFACSEHAGLVLVALPDTPVRALRLDER